MTAAKQSEVRTLRFEVVSVAGKISAPDMLATPRAPAGGALFQRPSAPANPGPTRPTSSAAYSISATDLTDRHQISTNPPTPTTPTPISLQPPLLSSLHVLGMLPQTFQLMPSKPRGE